MNELEARRQLLVDPRRLSAELQAAVDASESLAAFRAELLRNDDAVNRVLTETRVPEGLADRIVLRARYRDRKLWSLALAASVVAAAMALPWYFTTVDRKVELAMIEHVDKELWELRDNSGVEPAALRASVAALGVDVRDPGYRIRHLSSCIVAGNEGRHFTVDGPGGVVSFLVLPAGGYGLSSDALVREGATNGVFIRRFGVTIGVFTRDRADREELEKLLRRVIA